MCEMKLRPPFVIYILREVGTENSAFEATKEESEIASRSLSTTSVLNVAIRKQMLRKWK